MTMNTVPEVGKTYKSFDDGKIRESRMYEVTVRRIVPLSDADQETFANFLAWVENYNSYIINEWDAQANQKYDDEDNSVVGDFIDIEEEVA